MSVKHGLEPAETVNDCASEVPLKLERGPQQTAPALYTGALAAFAAGAATDSPRRRAVRRPVELDVVAELEDGTTLELLKRLGSPAAGPVARSKRSVPNSN